MAPAKRSFAKWDKNSKEGEEKANLQNKDRVKELLEILVKRSYTMRIRCLFGTGLPSNKSKRGKNIIYQVSI